MAGKPRADHSGLKALRAALKSGEVGRLYLFHGEEAYLREHCLRELKRLLLPPGLEEFNCHTVQGKEATPQRIAQQVDCLPMMSERTLVIVNDCDIFKTEAMRDGLTALFSDLPDYCCLVFVYDLIDYKPDGRTKLAAALKQYGAVVGFHRQEVGDLTDWIRRRFRALDHDIDSEQSRYLIFLCGELMHDLAGEISKIAAHAKQTRITKADIDAVATPQLNAVVFQLTDAISAGQYDQAMGVLGDLLRMQEAPVMITSVLGRQLRQLYAARLAVEAGQGTTALMELWRMHPYPAEKLIAAARKRSLGWCRTAVKRVFEVDLAMKSTGAGEDDLLTDFVLELAHAPSGVS